MVSTYALQLTIGTKLTELADWYLFVDTNIPLLSKVAPLVIIPHWVWRHDVMAASDDVMWGISVPGVSYQSTHQHINTCTTQWCFEIYLSQADSLTYQLINYSWAFTLAFLKHIVWSAEPYSKWLLL